MANIFYHNYFLKVPLHRTPLSKCDAHFPRKAIDIWRRVRKNQRGATPWCLALDNTLLQVVFTRNQPLAGFIFQVGHPWVQWIHCIILTETLGRGRNASQSLASPGTSSLLYCSLFLLSFSTSGVWSWYIDSINRCVLVQHALLLCSTIQYNSTSFTGNLTLHVSRHYGRCTSSSRIENMAERKELIQQQRKYLQLTSLSLLTSVLPASVKPSLMNTWSVELANIQYHTER